MELLLEKELPLTKKGKVRKRKPKTKNMYFTQDTEDAILEYVKCKDDAKRNKIFNERINYAFHKLCENIIHTFKFYYLDVDSLLDLEHECVSLLITKLKGYKNVKGKAYSYFGTIIKRHLIVYNRKNYKRLKDQGQVIEVESDKHISNQLVNDYINDEPANTSLIIDKFVEHIDTNINTLFPKEKDQLVVNAVLQIFENRQNLEILTKKSLYIYIRELTNIPTPNITTIIKKLKKIYGSMCEKYMDY